MKHSSRNPGLLCQAFFENVLPPPCLDALNLCDMVHTLYIVLPCSFDKA